MFKSSGLIIFWLCATPLARAQQTVTVGQVGTFVPAGTLVSCILDEPSFSSETARPGDPILCKTTASVEMFGRSLIPRGAYVSAHLKNYSDPGHFVGKGWIQLEFTSLTLPGGRVPLDAKVIAATRYRVNGDGKIQGRGHAKRDAVEWAIPILWPIKVLTLPARGPRPTLKAETRIELRLMEDLVIPESVYSTSGALTPRSSALQPMVNESSAGPRSRLANFRSDDSSLPTQQPAPSIDRLRTTPPNRGLSAVSPRLALIVLRDGRIHLVTDYWIDKGKLGYTMSGALHEEPLNALDVPLTKELNAERGVSFVLTPRPK